MAEERDKIWCLVLCKEDFVFINLHDSGFLLIQIGSESDCETAGNELYSYIHDECKVLDKQLHDIHCGNEDCKEGSTRASNGSTSSYSDEEELDNHKAFMDSLGLVTHSFGFHMSSDFNPNGKIYYDPFVTNFLSNNASVLAMELEADPFPSFAKIMLLLE